MSKYQNPKYHVPEKAANATKIAHHIGCNILCMLSINLTLDADIDTGYENSSFVEELK